MSVSKEELESLREVFYDSRLMTAHPYTREGVGRGLRRLLIALDRPDLAAFAVDRQGILSSLANGVFVVNESPTPSDIAREKTMT